MALKLPTFDKEADIPKPFAALYEERDGKWHPKADEDEDDLAAELATERAKRDAAEKLAKKTASEIAKLQRQMEAGKDGITPEARERIAAEVRKEVEEELAERITAGEAAAKENRALKLDSQVQRLAGEVGFLAPRIPDVWKLHAEEFDLADDGKVIVKANPKTDPRKHLEAIAKARPEWVQGTKANGSGAMGGAGGAATPGMSFEDAVKDPGALIGLANAKASK